MNADLSDGFGKSTSVSKTTPTSLSRDASSQARQGISTIVPAYNEEKALAQAVRGLLRTYQPLGFPFEIIIVDDGSTDHTDRVAEQLVGEHSDHVALVRLPRHLGIGAALQAGFGQAKCGYVTVCPADVSMDCEDLKPFLMALGSADVIVGVRPQRVGYNMLMRLNSWLYVRMVRLFFGLKLRDVNWICFYRRSLLGRIEITESGIPMLLEVLAKMRDLGGTFHEVESVQHPREVGVASASRFRVMWGTAVGFFRLWWRWRRSRNKYTVGR